MQYPDAQSDNTSTTDVFGLVCRLLEAPRARLCLGTYSSQTADTLADALATPPLKTTRQFLRLRLECALDGLMEVGSAAFVARFGQHARDSLGSDAFRGQPVAAIIRIGSGYRLVRGVHDGSEHGRLLVRINSSRGVETVLALDVQTFFAASTEDASTADRVRAAIPTLLDEGEPTLERAARLLRVGRRTLQRRLGEEDTTFGALLEEVRISIAKQAVLEERLTFAEVSYRLGFSRESAFFRAFKRWTGMTPTEFRKLG